MILSTLAGHDGLEIVNSVQLLQMRPIIDPRSSKNDSFIARHRSFNQTDHLVLAVKLEESVKQAMITLSQTNIWWFPKRNLITYFKASMPAFMNARTGFAISLPEMQLFLLEWNFNEEDSHD